LVPSAVPLEGEVIQPSAGNFALQVMRCALSPSGALVAGTCCAALLVAASGVVFLLKYGRKRCEDNEDGEDDAAYHTTNLETKLIAVAGDTVEVEDLAGPKGAGDYGMNNTSRHHRQTLPQLKKDSRIDEVNADVDVETMVNPQLPGKQRIYVKTFGCAHNNSDGEFMMGLLREYGYELADNLEMADACVVNSCTVKNPSQDTAVHLAQRAREAGKAVILAGCVPTADPSIPEQLTGVSMLSVTQIDRIVEVVDETLQGNTVKLLGKSRTLPTLDLPKVRRNSYVEVIPISGGCLGNCAYCKTKHARGKLASYTQDAIVGRALQAVAEGVSEVWLTSEDTGAYGLDIGTDISSLLHRIADVLPTGVMLKLGMTNPPYMLAHMDSVASVLQRPNVFAFMHIPVQSGSDSVLQAMVREYTVSDFMRLVDGLRSAVPGITIATDIICGYPSESEQDHVASIELVKQCRFPVLNISQFYPRPGTPAARLRRLPGSVVKNRSTEMHHLFNSYETHSALVGKTTKVWFCESDAQRGQTVGHTKNYAKVIVKRDDTLLGKSASVKIDDTSKWHLEGHIVAEAY